MPNGSGYVSPIIGASLPDWLDDFDIAKVVGVDVEKLDSYDSMWVSRARVKINVDRVIENGGHFKPLEGRENE